MNIEITNVQKIKKINLPSIYQYTDKISEIIYSEYSAVLKKIFLGYKNAKSYKTSLVLCDNNFIIKLNKKFFGKNYPTDVLSFSLASARESEIRYNSQSDIFGEIVVSVEEAVIWAKKNNSDWREELILYIIHGILHLLGYNDKYLKEREIMEKRQDKIMKILFSANEFYGVGKFYTFLHH